ncbi:membrane integrity-associated transporter subunit PqiC [Accumulibacter sp.]|uniref:PqiC family protein n=1 Tax=Accumulibacter sp. TaxID=2053492 RepID=UPI0025DEA36B|nr:PqiC family protein [Accumulibacter sp.]MCM8595642.1 PqiC family protein [Accumulibacter sp.]MDS4049789.1 PqiC family protein [Accumulibacter sp.]
MNRRSLGGLRVVLALGAAIVTGCASPPAHFYTLSSTAAVDHAEPATFAVAVDGVSIPAAVDRPQFVIRRTANEVSIDEFNRWAAPLGPAIARVVAANLGALLGTPRVVSGPLAAGFDPAYRIGIDVQRFDSLAGEGVAIDAVWVVRKAAGQVVASGRSSLGEPAHGDGCAALAAAHSRAIARLSEQLAAALRGAAGR